MIEFTKAFKTTDGETHASLEDAKRHEIELLLAGEPSMLAGDAPSDIASTILENAERIVDILTTKGSSRPKARKINKKKLTPNENQTKP